MSSAETELNLLATASISYVKNLKVTAAYPEWLPALASNFQWRLCIDLGSLLHVISIAFSSSLEVSTQSKVLLSQNRLEICIFYAIEDGSLKFCGSYLLNSSLFLRCLLATVICFAMSRNAI